MTASTETCCKLISDALKDFSVNAMIEKIDIRALAPFKKLERVSINVPSDSIDSLLDLSALKEAGAVSQEAGRSGDLRGVGAARRASVLIAVAKRLECSD
ncbi:UNVERIFIED_ORG: hypothetical protein GGD48_004894 [Rhizobium etli]